MAVNSQTQVERMEAQASIQVNQHISEVVYHEIPERSAHVDVLQQLKQNILMIEDLHSRLQFVMGEIRTVLKC